MSKTAGLYGCRVDNPPKLTRRFAFSSNTWHGLATQRSGRSSYMVGCVSSLFFVYTVHILGVLARLTRLYCGHGPVVDAAEEKIKFYIKHRKERENQIMQALTAAEGRSLSSIQVCVCVRDRDQHPEMRRLVCDHCAGRKLCFQLIAGRPGGSGG